MDFKNLPDIQSLRFEGLRFAHEGQDPILKNCDFEFPVDRYVWVKSPEGEGKSSLLQVMAGLMLPQAGSYYMNDLDVVPMSFEEFLPYRLRIGFTFDYGGLINNQTIEDNLTLPLLYHKLVEGAEARQRVKDLLSRFELKKFAAERPAHVPGRVRKLAVLLRGLLIYPQLLLLDDPSIGLGEKTQDHFVDYLNELRSDGRLRHVFISSYDESFMRRLPHDIVHLDEGTLYHQPHSAEKRAVNQ